jgi:hypothetical protein
MTSVTIDLPPEIYERLRAEAERLGKAEPMLAQEILMGQLLAAAPIEVPLYLSMLPQIRALVATMNPEDFNVSGNATPDETIAVLRSWTEAEREDEDDEGGESWEDVLRSIDANRTSYRKHFPDLEEPA